jgi:SAM-dependent methyltransferase
MTEIWQRFDQAASTYEVASVLQQQSAQALLTWMGPQAAGSVWLDAGCGTGWLTRQLADQGLRVWAIDRALNMLQGLRSLDQVQIICADLRELPLPDGMLDGLVSNFVLHWLDVDILPELLRVVRPQGELYVALPVQGSLHDVQARFAGFPVFDFQPEQAWLDAAGPALVDWQIMTVQQSFACLRDLLRALRQMGGNQTLNKNLNQSSAEQQSVAAATMRTWLQDDQPVNLDFRVLMLHLRVPVSADADAGPDRFLALMNQLNADPRFHD